MSQKRVSVVLFVLLALLVGACGGGGGAGEEELLRVAVIMPSTINDLAFSQSMYD
jgi:basic membrane lipoprotein Med (substrate-binding protein (PBP1-ABC) superfamily)